MRSQIKFTSEHITALCQRGISILIVIALALNLIHKATILINGVSDPFQDSELAHSIFSLRLINFALTTAALCLQSIHLATQKGGLITKIVILILIVSFGVNQSIQYQVKSLQNDEYNSKDDSKSMSDPNQNCLANQHKLWPASSLELYNEASKLNCTEGCPCIGNNLSLSGRSNEVSFQSCLLSEKTRRYQFSQQSPQESVNNNQSFNQEIKLSSTEQIQSSQDNQRLSTIQKLIDIEETLECSGICDSKDIYIFWDATKDISLEQNNQSCYSRAVNFVQKDVLLPARNQSITIIFIVIFLLIQEIFISKSSIIIQFAKQKLGACFALPLSRQANQQNPDQKSTLQNQETDQNQKQIKIQLIDLTKKIIFPKNKDQKCSIKLNLSPRLLKSDEDAQNSPNAQTPNNKQTQYNQQDSIKPENE